MLNCFIERERKRSKATGNKERGDSRQNSELKSSNTPEPTDTIATDGIDINAVTMPLQGGKEMIWDCWDYAGQEIYYTTHQFFLSPRSVYLICFNLLDRDTSKIEYWINSVHSRARGSPMFLIGTHVDDKACTDDYVDEFISRLIAVIKPDRFRNKLGVQSIKGIHALSCKKRTGIRELIEDISEVIQKARFVGQLFPSSWLKLEHTLGTLRDSTTRILNWKEFERIAVGCQIEKESVEEAAKFLHSTGIICYFSDIKSGLNDLVILDPQFLTNVMSCMVTLKHRYGTEGVIYQKDLIHIWKEFPRELHKTLMNLLEKFEISHCLPDKKTGSKKYIIPCLLSSKMPESINDYWPIFNNLKTKQLNGLIFCRIYRFAFLPLGFFSRLFVRNLHLPNIKSLIHWADGQLLKLENILALLRYNPTTFVLSLQVYGEKSDILLSQYNLSIRLLRILIENIETTIEGWYEAHVNVVIPCSHCLISPDSYSQWEFPIEECIEAIAHGHAYVLCRNIRKIRLDILAPDISLADLKKLQINFNEIEIGDEIGEGAFGIVCKGFYKGELVAIKQLADDGEYDESSLSTNSFGFSESTLTYSEEKEELLSKFVEFQREVWLMSCLQHKNICSLKGISMSPMTMIMDYLELGDLFHLIGKVEKEKKFNCNNYDKKQILTTNCNSSSSSSKNNSQSDEKQSDDHDCNLINSPSLLLDFDMKILICFDIALGMKHLHTFEPPIIHRDLRTPNIFIKTLDYHSPVRALVGDFGLSRLFASSLAGGAFNRNWLAPEVMKGENYTGKMDVYSFAIIMWEIITLLRPFEEYDDIFNGKPASFFKKAVIDGLRPTIPKSCNKKLSHLIESCWNPKPSKRPDFIEIVRILKEIIVEMNIPYNFNDDNDADELLDKSLHSDDHEIPFIQRLTLNQTDDYIVAENCKSIEDSDIECVNVMTKVGKNTIWCAVADGFIQIWDLTSYEKIHSFSILNSEKIYSILNISDRIVWISDSSGKIYHYTVDDYKKVYTLREHNVPICSMCLVTNKSQQNSSSSSLSSSSGGSKKKTTRCVWSSDVDGTIIIWKFNKNSKSKVKQKIKLNHRIGCMTSIGALVAVGTESSILLLDSVSGNVAVEWNGHTSLVNSIIVHKNQIWSCSNDGSILVWEPCVSSFFYLMCIVF